MEVRRDSSSETGAKVPPSLVLIPLTVNRDYVMLKINHEGFISHASQAFRLMHKAPAKTLLSLRVLIVISFTLGLSPVLSAQTPLAVGGLGGNGGQVSEELQLAAR
jgi:hypothetical protein